MKVARIFLFDNRSRRTRPKISNRSNSKNQYLITNIVLLFLYYFTYKISIYGFEKEGSSKKKSRIRSLVHDIELWLKYLIYLFQLLKYAKKYNVQYFQEVVTHFI